MLAAFLFLGQPWAASGEQPMLRGINGRSLALSSRRPSSLALEGAQEAIQRKVGEIVAFHVYGSNIWYVDMSDLKDKLELLQGIMTREQFERLMFRTFREVGQKSKKMISDEVRKKYEAPAGWVKAQIQHFRLSFGGGFPVTCIIPISSTKGVIGPRFKLSGRKRKVSAKIVKGGVSVLPKKLDAQGGNPPFVWGGVAFTRRTKKRFPIVRVVGLAVPQMPMNRSKPGVTNALLEYTQQRLEHNFMYMFGR